MDMGDVLQCAPHGRKLHGTLHAHKISPEEEEEEEEEAGGVESSPVSEQTYEHSSRTQDARRTRVKATELLPAEQ